jgi:hypothetical protein
VLRLVWGLALSWRSILFIFLSGRTLRICCLNVFNVCTCLYELIVALLFKNSTNKILSLSQKTLANYPHKSVLWIYFPSSRYSPDSGPSDFHFLVPWSMHSKDALLQKTTSWNTAFVKITDASAKHFTRLAYSVSGKGGKVVLITKKIFKNIYIKFVTDVLVTYVNFIVNLIIVTEKK